MNTKEQVLQLLSAGKITAVEGEELLNALNQPPRSRRQYLVNPFENLRPSWGLLWGALGALTGVALSRWNVRFDGALDLHGGTSVGVTEALLDQIVAWPLLAMVLWGAAALCVRPVRFVDFLSNVGVARLPYLLPALWIAAMQAQRGHTGLMLLAIFTFLPFVWVITWLWQGFRIASGLLGPKAGLLFTGALLVAEVASKVALGVAGSVLHLNGL